MTQKNILKITMLFIFVMITNLGYGQEITESFDNWTDGSYGATSVYGEWISNKSLTETSTSRSGKCVRLRNDSNSYLEYVGEDGNGKDDGVGIISFWYRSWDASPTAIYDVQVSINGAAYTNIGDQISTSSTTYTQWSHTINSTENNIKVKIIYVSGERLLVDDFKITEFSTSNPEVTFNTETSTETETDGTFTITIPVTVSNYNGNQIDLTVNVTGGTAEVADYTLNTATLTYTADGSKNISLDIVADTEDFDDETIILTIAEGGGTSVTDLVILQATHTVTVTDDETAPTIGFDAATSSQTETDASFTVTIPVTVASYSGTQIDVSVASSGTAESSDFTLNTASLSFTANSSQNISLDINNDEDADEETVILTITETSAVSGLVISQSTHNVTITDDEAPSIIITEVADPTDFSGRFVEIYNNGNTAINLATEQIYFVKSVNAGSDYSQIALTGTIQPNTILIIANSTDLNNDYGFTADVNFSNADGNGDDAYYLYYGGDRFTGTVLDAYGVAGIDGSDQPWEYEDSRAVRINTTAVNPNPTWTSSEWTITSGDLADMTPGALENEFRYDGDWKPRDVYANSSATDAVYISSSVALTGNLSVTNFEIETDQIATINSGVSLIVSGTSSGDVTYNVSVADDKWHLVSSPVVGEQYDDTWVTDNAVESGSETANNRAIATYQNGTLDETTGPWTYFQTGGAATTFGSGTGYSLKRTNSGTYSFTGTFPTTNITPAVTQNVTNWNLVGNPYPSYINIETFLSTNSTKLDGAFQSIYVWNANTGSYDDLATGFVHPGQAFFVNAASTPETVSFTEAMQSHQTGVTFYKTENTTVIDLNLTSGESTKSTQINYLENKTTGLDPRFDIGMFDGVASDIRIYTQLINNNEGISFRRQALPNSEYENMVIPVGVNAAAGKEITFSAEVLNVPADIKVFLEDRFTNTYTRLDETNSEYKVTLTESLNGVGRFYLHTTQSALSTDAVVLNSVQIYKTGVSTLKITGLPQGKTSFYLYNILGKEMMKTLFTSNGNKEISLSKLASGIYVAKMQTEKGAISKKIILE